MNQCSCKKCQFKQIIEMLDIQGRLIMALNDDLQAVLAEVSKGTGEVVSKIADLEQQLSDLQAAVAENADAKAQLDAAQQTLADLKSAAQTLDDVVPDAPVEPPVEPPA